MTSGGTSLRRERQRSAERLASAGLVGVAVTFGLGDIAQVSPLDSLILNAVHGLLLLVIGLALASAAWQRRWRRLPREISLPTAVWLGGLLLSATLAQSYRSYAIAALERPLRGALLAWAVWYTCRTEQRWLRLLQALSLGGMAIAVIALAEASGAPVVRTWLAGVRDGEIPIGDIPRVAATLSHPNEAAMLLELSLPLLVAWAWSSRSAWGILPALAVLGTMLAIVLTFSRAGMVVALAALGILGGLAAARHERQRLVPVGLAALVLPLALGWASISDPGLEYRLLAGVDESSSVQPPRPEFWAGAVAMLRDHPLFGVGLDNFRWQFASYSGVPADNLGIHAHNQYLETLADTGVVGLLSFGWLLATLVRITFIRLRCSNSDWPWRAALLASLSAWLLHALLDDFERFWPTSVAFWLIVGLNLSCGSAQGRQLAIEQPEDAADDRDHHQQHQDAGWTG